MDEVTEPRQAVGSLPVPFCSVREFAAASGLCEHTVFKLVRTHELPAMKLGRRILIRTDEFLSEGRRA